MCVYLKDMDGDHRVSFKDFQEAIKQERLLLQGFGQCLPDDKVKTVLSVLCSCSEANALFKLLCFTW